MYGQKTCSETEPVAALWLSGGWLEHLHREESEESWYGVTQPDHSMRSRQAEQCLFFSGVPETAY